MSCDIGVSSLYDLTILLYFYFCLVLFLHTQQLKTAHIFGITISVAEESGHILIGSFFGSHKTAIKVSVRTGISSDVRQGTDTLLSSLELLGYQLLAVVILRLSVSCCRLEAASTSQRSSTIPCHMRLPNIADYFLRASKGEPLRR